MSYIIYVLLFTIVNYKTNLGFDYNSGFELLWGSIIATLILKIIGDIIFRISYKMTGDISKTFKHNKENRRSLHWKFRLILSLLVLIFSLTPLCSLIISPLVHNSYEYITKLLIGYYNYFEEQLVNAIYKLM